MKEDVGEKMFLRSARGPVAQKKSQRRASPLREDQGLTKKRKGRKKNGKNGPKGRSKRDRYFLKGRSRRLAGDGGSCDPKEAVNYAEKGAF